MRELAERVAPTVDLCGQHEHQRLLDPATHVEMVDAWAGAPVAQALDAYRAALGAARAAARELERVEAAARTEGSRVEEARFAKERIDEVDPREGELEELEEELPRAEHAEALAACAHEASEALSGDEGALNPLNGAIAELSRMGSVDEKLAEFADAPRGRRHHARGRRLGPQALPRFGGFRSRGAGAQAGALRGAQRAAPAPRPAHGGRVRTT